MAWQSICTGRRSVCLAILLRKHRLKKAESVLSWQHEVSAYANWHAVSHQTVEGFSLTISCIPWRNCLCTVVRYQLLVTVRQCRAGISMHAVCQRCAQPESHAVYAIHSSAPLAILYSVYNSILIVHELTLWLLPTVTPIQ